MRDSDERPARRIADLSEAIQQGKTHSLHNKLPATSSLDRAIEIIEMNGLLAIKAHIIKNGASHRARRPGRTLPNYLDLIFSD